MTEFQGVLPAFNQALTKRGYKDLTPVQKAVLEPELSGADLLVSAQTGSGKTVAFGLALAPTLLNGNQSFGNAPAPIALVIAPTRELALQVTRELEWLYETSGARVISCVGGMDVRSEQRQLKNGPHIVVGTPGRLCDHIKRGFFDTSQLKAVVLDEADEMLDMGFREELQYILDTTPKQRRTLLFSATIPSSIISMAKKYQNDAKRITTQGEAKQHLDIEYQALTIAPSDHENAIINLLRYHDAKSAIIFCATRIAVTHMTSRLTNRGFSVVALSGELSQNERTHALQALRDGRAQVCVATDVASRGIDLPGLALVIHADVPKSQDTLLHRSGRTGRAGSKGISALIVPHNWRSRAENLLRSARVEAKWGKPPSISEILKRDRERFLANPALNDPIKEEEKEAVQELIARFTPEQVAAALMRLHNTQKPAPEELLDAPSSERPRQSQQGQANFTNSVWVSLSIGRNDSAEARWLLPMLCKAGHITKSQIGSIRVNNTDSHIELAAECVDGFFSAIDPSGKIEKNIVVTRLASAPKASQDNHSKPRRFDRDSKKKPHRGSGFNDRFNKRADERKTPDTQSAEGDKSRQTFKKKPKADEKNKPRSNRNNNTKPSNDRPNRPSHPKK